MNLKNAAFLALIGTILTTFLLAFSLASAILNASQGLIAAMSVFPLLIYSFASLTLAIFFFVYHKQS